MSRDKILALLWPDAADEQGRTVLRQTLYALRRDLDAPDLVIGATELRLNRDVIACDLTEFEEALQRGDGAQALSAYGGPFLDGFHVSGAPEFERWVDGERRRIDDLARSGLETLATDAERQSEFAIAAGWWRRLSALDPFNSRVALGFIRSLVAAGDPGGAVVHAELHQSLVRQELGSEPDAAFLAFSAQLRSHSASSLRPPAEPPRSPAIGRQSRVEQFMPHAAYAEASAAAADSVAGQHQRRRLTRQGLILAVVVVATAGALTRVWRPNESAPGGPPPLSSNMIVVFPFAVHGGTESEYLSEGMIDLLGRNLFGAGDLRAVEPSVVLTSRDAVSTRVFTPSSGAQIARGLGAGLFVLGDITEVGGRLRIGASVFGSAKPDSLVTSVGVNGRAEDVFSLVDSLTRELIGGLHRSPGERLDGLAATTTSSLPALKAFLEGESRFRHTRFAEAVDAFQRATSLDTTFALAFYRLSVAADYMSRSDIAGEAAERAAHLAGRLTPMDATLLDARQLWWRGATDEAERLCRQVLDRHPENIEAWNLLGEVLLHANPLRGRRIAEARPAFERVLMARPDDKEALDHLMRIAGYERRQGEMLRLARMGFRMGVLPGEPSDSVTAWRVVLLEDSASFERVFTTRKARDFGSAHASAARLAAFGGSFDAAIRMEGLLLLAGQPPSVQALGHITLAELGLARGRWGAARADLAAAAVLDHLQGTEYAALLGVTLYLTPDLNELARLRIELEALNVRDPPPGRITHPQPSDGANAVIRRYLVGLASARLGDTAITRESAAELARVSTKTSQSRELAGALSHSLRALLAWQQGRPRDALAELETSQLETSLETLSMPFGSRSWERYLRAEVLHALGRDDEALGWYESMGQNWTYDLIYFAPSLAKMGAILERKGRVAEAAQRYGQAVELWHDADPELQAVIEPARLRLAVLCRANRNLAACQRG